MLIKILSIIFLLFLFFFLSKSADLIVVHLRKIGEKLGIKIFFLGIILGIMTSLPEMAIGINSSIKGVLDISFANLLGGIIVLFGLILSISAILNREIKTVKKSWPFLITLLFLFLPLILGFKGELNYLDGLILVLSYIALLYYLYLKNKGGLEIKIEIVNRNGVSRHAIFIIIGMLGLILSSELIVRTTILILEDYNISTFIVGLLFYSIGTNLPELIIAIRSFKRKVEGLSFSNLIGSSIGNVLILGILSLIKPMKTNVDTSYIFLMIFSFLFFIILYIFYRSDRLLSRKEGFFILLFYLIFVFSQIFIQINF